MQMSSLDAVTRYELGCRTFIQLCRRESVVRQCVNESGLKGLLTTSSTLDRIHLLCDSSSGTFIGNRQSQDICDQCLTKVESCPPLAVYTKLCALKYPEFEQTLPPPVDSSDVCRPWFDMCQVLPYDNSKHALCTTPIVHDYRPWLHFDRSDHFILSNWTLKDWPGFSAAFIAAFTIGFLFAGHQVLDIWLIQTLKTSQDETLESSITAIDEENPTENTPLLSRNMLSNAYRFMKYRVTTATLGGSQFLLAAFMVLVTASFNGIVILACFLGLVSGYLVFGRSSSSA